MNQLVSDIGSIKDVVKVLNSGVEFYEQAKDKVHDKHLKTAFNQILMAKKLGIDRLQDYVFLKEDDIEDGHSFPVDIRKAYANILSSVSDTDKAFIDNLEEVEDKTLEKMSEARDKNQHATVAPALYDIHQKMQKCHDTMYQLKKIA